LQWLHVSLPQNPTANSVRLSGTQKKFVKTIDKAVVDITATSSYTFSTERATGMVITPSGLVLTNNHAIAGATAISVREVDGGATYPARVVGYDPTLDVAVLQLTGAHGLATIPLALHSKISVGEAVLALGNAAGTNATPMAVTGKVLGKHKSITASGGPTGSESLGGLIFDNAPIVPGDSGGPLVSPKGRVIAMDTAAAASLTSYSPSASPEPRSYAIPIATAEKVVAALRAHLSLAGLHVGPSAFLGVEIGASPTSTGAVLVGLLPNSPAAQVLVPGDVITAVNAVPVTTPTSLLYALGVYSPGDTITLTYSNPTSASNTAQVTLSAGPAQ
jgi:S1-C subfamily serine protease